MENTYDLFNLETDSQVYNRFRRCLTGAARDQWDDIVSDNVKSPTNFLFCLETYTTEVVGDEAHEIQEAYLRTTPKPNEITVERWLQQVRNINNTLPLLDPIIPDHKFTDRDLIHLCITPNLPTKWLTPFRLANGHKKMLLRDIVPLLKELSLGEQREKADRQDGRKGNEKGKHKPKSSPTAGNTAEKKETKGGTKRFKNDCSIAGHTGHDWYDCANNPKSKNYNGTTIMLKKKEEKNTTTKPKKEENHQTDDAPNQKHPEVKFDTPYDNDEQYHATHENEPAYVESAEVLISFPTKTSTSTVTNTTFIALIDTGASSNLIDPSLLPTLLYNIKTAPKDERLDN